MARSGPVVSGLVRHGMARLGVVRKRGSEIILRSPFVMSLNAALLDRYVNQLLDRSYLYFL